MLQSGPSARPFLPIALLCGLLSVTAVSTVGCGGEKAPASPPAKSTAAAPQAAKPAPSAAETMKKAGDTVSDAANTAAGKTAAAVQKTQAAAEKGVEKTAEAVKDSAQKAGDALEKSADKAQALATDAVKSAAEALKKTDATVPVTLPGAQPAATLPAGHSENDGHDHGAADAQKPLDTTGDVVDPNSKAKLTYEFGSDTKNFGKVMQGDVLNHKFDLASSGEEDLVIKQAKPTCGCTVAQIAVQQPDGTLAPYTFGQPIAPGRKVEISATLHTQNKRGHAGSRINIFSNDPRGQTQLGLEADVEPFFQITPNVLNFNTMSAKETKTDKLSIGTTRGERIKLSAVKDNTPQALKIELNALDADTEGKATRWELAATAGPGLVEGNLAYAVPLKSDLPIPGAEKLPNGTVPTYDATATVMARVTGMISYNPAFVSFGLIRPGQVVSRSIRITSHDAEFKLTEPKVLVQGRDTAEWEYAKHFSTVVRPVAGENAVDVELRLDGMPDTLNSSFSGILTLQIGHPEKPELKLPITGVCRGSAVAPAPGTPAAQTVPAAGDAKKP